MHTVHVVFHYCICTNLSQIHNKHTQKLVEILRYFPKPRWWGWGLSSFLVGEVKRKRLDLSP